MASRSKSSSKSKKKGSPSPSAVGFGKKNLKAELKRAIDFLRRDKLDKAYDALTELNQDYPNTSDVLVELANYYATVADLNGYQQTCEQLIQLDAKQPIFTLGLANSYLASGSLFLALQTFQLVTEQWPEHLELEDVNSKIATIEAEVENILAELNLAHTAEGIEVATQHEKVQRHLDRGNFQTAAEMGEALLEQAPALVALHNNVSLAYFLNGDFSRALDHCEQALAKENDNIHALGNSIRYLYCLGEVEKAEALVPRLLASQSKAADPWTKKIEAVSYLGDYETVLEIYQQAQASGEIKNTSNYDFFLHLAAVAMARLGRLGDARSIWQEVLMRSPRFQLAKQNLDDSNQISSQRNGAWSFAFNQWIGTTIINNLLQQVRASGAFSESTLQPNAKSEEILRGVLTHYLEQYPFLNHLVAVWLDRGDSAARQFAWMIANSVQSPQHLEAIKAFALGQWGPDDFRYQAAITATQAKVMGKKARLWLKGEWKDIILMAYEFHEEPENVYPQAVTDKLSEALELLRAVVDDPDREDAAANYETILQLLNECLEQVPNAPDIAHNLATAYHSQGCFEEAIAIWDQLTADYPDYVHSRTSRARLYLKDATVENIEQAKSLLLPLLELERFHYDHFAEFSDAYIQLLLAQDQEEGAKHWVDMWTQVDPEHPRLFRWQLKFMDPEKMKELVQQMGHMA